MSHDSAAARTVNAGERNGVLPFALFTLDDLAARPAPTYLVNPCLPAEGTVVLYGPSGAIKSFTAQSWSLAIAADANWYGRAVRGGGVVYIAGEGVSGLARRFEALLTDRQLPSPTRLWVLPHAVNLLEPADVRRARATLATLPEPPKLIVFDTLARSMPGGDENTARDVGRAIAAGDELRGDATALYIHHAGWNAEHERGSSALRGAADIVMSLRPDGENFRLACDKAKDAEPFEPLALRLERVAPSAVVRVETSVRRLTADDRKILELVSRASETTGATRAAVHEASELSRATAYRTMKALIDRGFLATEGNARSAPLQLTATARQALVSLVSGRLNVPNGTAESSLTPTPSIGVRRRDTQDAIAIATDDEEQLVTRLLVEYPELATG
jgi:hypothetical protein